MSTRLFGGIEGGGTKFNCVVGTGPNDIRAETLIGTTTPHQTLKRVIHFFQMQEHRLGTVSAIGVACFGPLDPRRDSPSFGKILKTPKPGWNNADVVGTLRLAFSCPIGFDTDVNGAALAEGRWGAAQGVATFLYLTIGTGIGGGVIANGQLVHGLLHPEMGHIRLPHDSSRDPFDGSCPYHRDCFEGLASGFAIEQRWRQPGTTLSPDHPAWELEAHYIALALANFIFSVSPERIVIGGGVAQQPQLLSLVRKKTIAALGGYLASPAILQDSENYITLPALGQRAGSLGALILAEQAIQQGL